MWDKNPITSAKPIPKLKNPIKTNGINQIIECPIPLCLPTILSIISGNTDITSCNENTKYYCI